MRSVDDPGESRADQKKDHSVDGTGHHDCLP